MLYQFIDAYFPDSLVSAFDVANTADWLIRWKSTIAKMSTTDPLLTQTVAALGLALIGQRSTNAAMSRQGVKLYSTVLLQLTKILQGPRGAAINPDLLASVLLMGLWEQFNGFSAVGAANQGRGWHAHTQGMKRLLETRGPHGFADDRAFLVLQAAQTSQFTAAFAARKGTSLASHAWRTAPWAHRPKSPRDRFFDIAFRLPGIVEEADLAIASGSPSEGLRLLNELHQVYAELVDWKDSLQSWIDHVYFSSPDSVYPDPFNLDTTELHTGLLYCSVNIHVIILLNNLTSTLVTTEFSYLRADIPDIVPYAIWILQAIPVSMQDGGICGSQSTLFPTGAVRWSITYLKGSPSRSDDVVLLEALLANSRKEMGYKKSMDGFLGNICDIRAQRPPISIGCGSSHAVEK